MFYMNTIPALQVIVENCRKFSVHTAGALRSYLGSNSCPALRDVDFKVFGQGSPNPKEALKSYTEARNNPYVIPKP